MAKSEKSLLYLLEREDELLGKEKEYGDSIMRLRNIQAKYENNGNKDIVAEYEKIYEKIIDGEIKEREEILKSIDDVRSEIAAYLRDTLAYF